MNKVIVVGSVNMDITARTDKLPDTGETVAARSVEYLPGGKGLNQAVAAAKIGTTVVLAGCLGSDSFADELASFVRRHKIDVSCLRRSEKNSGIALITVDERGQNTIVVAPGSNADVCPEDVKKLPVSPGDVVVCQFAVAAAFAKARRYGARTILNPSPVCPIPDEIFRNTDILIVNETELAFLSRENVDENTPAEKIADAAEKLKTDAEQTVIVTLGSRGALVAGSKDMLFVDSYKVPAVDTVGAGDCFAGVFAAKLAEGKDVGENVKTAARAAAVCVTRKGAAPAMPDAGELEHFCSVGCLP